MGIFSKIAKTKPTGSGEYINVAGQFIVEILSVKFFLSKQDEAPTWVNEFVVRHLEVPCEDPRLVPGSVRSQVIRIEGKGKDPAMANIAQFVGAFFGEGWEKEVSDGAYNGYLEQIYGPNWRAVMAQKEEDESGMVVQSLAEVAQPACGAVFALKTTNRPIKNRPGDVFTVHNWTRRSDLDGTFGATATAA